MKNKKRKIILLIISIILFCALIGTGIYITFNKPKYNTEIIKETYGPISFIELDYDIIDIIDNGYLLVTKDDKQFLINDSNEIIKELDDNYDELDVVNNYIILNKFEQDNRKSKVLDTGGKELYTSNNPMYFCIDSTTNNIFFKEYFSDKVRILNSNFEAIIEYAVDSEGDYYTVINNNKIYINKDKLIYDTNGNKLDGYKEIYYIGKLESSIFSEKEIYDGTHLIVEYENKVELIDIKKASIEEYEKIEIYKENYILTKNDESKVISREGIIEKDKEYTSLDNGYYMDRTNCESEGILKDNKGNIIYDKCSTNYDLSHIKDGVFIARKYSKEEFTEELIVNGKKIVSGKYIIKFVGDYINVQSYDNETTIIYDLKGNISDKTYNNLGYINKKYYIYDEGKSIELDNKLNETNVMYDSIYCDKNNICIVEKDSTDGIYYNGDWLIELENFYSINDYYKDDNLSYYILKNIDGYSLLKFSKSKELITKENIKTKNKYKSIDIESIINEYHLEDMKEIIYKNEDFFRKYTYTTLNNKALKDYRQYIFNIYKPIIDNEDKLNTNYFLNSLSKLSINPVDKVDCDGVEAVGCYDYDTLEISYLNKLPSNNYQTEKTVIYHELMHFIDFQINDNTQSNFYMCDDEYYTGSEYYKLDYKTRKTCENIGNNYTKFITEAGAEYNEAKYFNNGITDVYVGYLTNYVTLMDILGEDKIQNIFYSNTSDYDLYNLFKDKLKYDEYTKLLELLNKDEPLNIDNTIAIYNLFGKKWYKNNESKYLIYRRYISENYFNFEVKDSKYEAELREHFMDCSKIYDKIIDELFPKDQNKNYSFDYTYKEGKIYIILNIKFDISDSSDTKYEVYIIDYDFENNKIVDYKKVEN